ncbi:MAG: oligosaccharide flippase family protein [Candidatus Pacearchaeota archaeon]|jgi:O-antigen/teichoic acid export membrane protein
MLKSTYLKNKETIHNFIWRSIQIFGKQGITFLIFIICAKLLLPYDFGIYNYVLTIVFFLVIFGDFGISASTSKYVAEYNATDKRKLKLVLFNSGIIILALTIIVTIITLLFGKLYLQEKYIYVLYLLPLIFLAPMTSLYDGIYRGLKKFKQLAIISVIIGLFSLTFIYFLINQYGLIGALIAQNIFYLLLFISLALGFRDFKFEFNKKIIKEIGSYSLIIGIGGLSYFIYSRINILILGNYNYIVEIGYYELINKIFLILMLPFNIFSQVISPQITELYSKKKIKNLIRDYKKYIFLSFILSLFISLIILFLFPIILKLFLNKYYNPLIIRMMSFMLVILVTQAITAISAVGFSTSTGHAKLNMYFLIIFGLINIPLTIIFIEYFGFIGVIYSTVLIRFITDISFTIIYFFILKSDLKKNEI